MAPAQENRIFREACDGFGFEEMQQAVDGVYCQGCMAVHKRPIKMYHSPAAAITPLCKRQVVRFYNPEEQ